MTIAKEGRRLLLNGTPITRTRLRKILKQHFSEASWERLWQDIEKYGRVHVAFVFVNKGKDRLK